MNLRTSSYTIWINLPNSPDRALLVHGISGAYDEVSRDVVAYLKSRRNGPRSKPLHGEWLPDSGDSAGLAPTLTADTLDRLESRGYLTALSVEEELNLFREVVGQLHKRRTTFSYIIVPTYDCNLRCPYCFQGSLRTNPSNRHLLTTMKPTMWNQILNAIERLEADGGLAAFKGFRSFTLFGGEPLLSSNVPLIEYMLNEALTRGPASFSAITNGTDLDSYKDLLGPTLIQWLQITVDGPPETHNKSRIYENGN